MPHRATSRLIGWCEVCRGANLGPCVTQGCEAQIGCQDYAPYCREHSDYPTWCDHDGDDICACSAPKERAPDDPVKRHNYDLQRAMKRVDCAVAARRSAEAELVAAQKALLPLFDPPTPNDHYMPGGQ